MLDSSDVIAFASATDLARAREFYEHALGLRCVERSELACVFDAHGTMLRVTAVAEVSTPGYTVIGWRVADVAATVRELAAAGVQMTRYDGLPQDPEGIWTTPGGDRVAWFADPDGNTLSLTEFVADQPLG